MTVHGKGSYISVSNRELLLEEQKKEVERLMETAVEKGRQCGISDEDIKAILQLILEG